MTDLDSLDDIAPKPKPNAGCGLMILLGIAGFFLTWVIVVIAAIKTLAS